MSNFKPNKKRCGLCQYMYKQQHKYGPADFFTYTNHYCSLAPVKRGLSPNRNACTDFKADFRKIIQYANNYRNRQRWRARKSRPHKISGEQAGKRNNAVPGSKAM